MYADSMAQLLTLPLELRLQIYYILITTALRTGRLSDLRGLFFACRQLSEEMQINCINKVRSICEIMYTWKLNHTYKRSLQVTLKLKTPNDIFVLSIPPTVLKKVAGLYSAESHAMLRSLQCAFRLPHPTLRIDVAVSERDVWLPTISLLLDILDGLIILNDGYSPFGDTARLIFRLESKHIEPKWTMDCLCHRMARLPRSDRLKGTWVAKNARSRSHSVWMFGFDFEEDLPDNVGVLYKNSVWRTNQYSDSSFFL